MTAIPDQKAAMRADAMARRAAAFRAAGAAAAMAVRDRFLAAFGNRLVPGMVISGYWPMGEELDIRPLLTALDGLGCACALSVTGRRGAPLVFRRWRPGDALVTERFGTSAPGPDAEPVVPRLLLVPLLAFDEVGCRLGYGAAFFDITLKALRAAGPVTAVGVAFEAQRVGAVPHEAHDERLDWVITEAAARQCLPDAASDKGTA